VNAAQDFLRRAVLAERAAVAVDHLGYRERMLSLARMSRERAAGCDFLDVPSARATVF
jgi:hypothetical protein